MYEFTTPTIYCTLTGVDFSQVDHVRLAIKGKCTQLVKVIQAEEIDPETGTAMLTLTQDETASLGVGTVSLQARIRYTSGAVQATNKVTKQLGDVIDEVVI